MSDMNRTRIIQVAHDLFKRRGYRGVTVSDLAENLGMSKKTIYQYFSGKKEIAEAVLEAVFRRISQSTNPSDLPPLQTIQKTFDTIKNEITRLGPLFLEDVQRYLPELWSRFEQFRAGNIKFLERLLVQAQQEGLVKDINPHLVIVIFFETVKAIGNPNAAAKHGYTLIELMDALIEIFWKGLLHPEAHDLNQVQPKGSLSED